MRPTASEKVVVVGAGHGGSGVVSFLRQYGFKGAITLVGDEPVAPYHRPPLSKAWLKGESSLAGLQLKPESFYADQGIDLRLGVAVQYIDAAKKQVLLGDGTACAYDHLVLATGARARKLPYAAQFDNLLTLRTLADAQRLRPHLAPGKQLVIVGGGYVGLECAATARALGADVVLIEKAPRLLERVASQPIADFLQRQHEINGVRFVLGASIASMEGDGSARMVKLEDGRSFACDAVLVGVGAVPATELAQAIGLLCDDGIQVDADCRTSNPHIFALGDVAKRPHPLYGRMLRLESVPSCMEQAKRVAAVISASDVAAAEVPWFWSDQYALKLQIAGLPWGATSQVLRGQPEAGKFAVFHLREGQVLCVEAIAAPQEFFAGKKLIASAKPVDALLLADSTAPLNELAA